MNEFAEVIEQNWKPFYEYYVARMKIGVNDDMYLKMSAEDRHALYLAYKAARWNAICDAYDAAHAEE